MPTHKPEKPAPRTPTDDDDAYARGLGAAGVLKGRVAALEEKLEGVDSVLSLVRLAWVVVKNKVPPGWENSVRAVDLGLEAIAEAVKP